MIRLERRDTRSVSKNCVHQELKIDKTKDLPHADSIMKHYYILTHKHVHAPEHERGHGHALEAKATPLKLDT